MTTVPTTTPPATTDTSATSASSAAASKQSQQFLKLLLTQLQNQSPIDPVDTTQFTSQLVQYSGLEQQIGTNDKLNSIISLLGGTPATS